MGILTVVAQGNELDIKYAALILPDTTNTHCVAIGQVTVQTRLGAIGLVEDPDGRVRGRRAAEALGLGDILAQSLFNLIRRRRGTLNKPQRHACCVTIHDGDAVAGGRDTQGLLLLKGSCISIKVAQDLLRLSFQLILLASDVGHNVINNIHAAHTWVASTRDGLHGDDRDGVNLSEAGLQGSERDDKTDDGAVTVADEEALLEAKGTALVVDHLKMVEINSGHDEGHEGIAAVVLRVGEDGQVGILELLLDLAGDIAVEATEDNIAVGELAGLALTHNELSDLRKHGLRLLPPHGIAILLAS